MEFVADACDPTSGMGTLWRNRGQYDPVSASIIYIRIRQQQSANSSTELLLTILIEITLSSRLRAALLLL
ncbi:MAG: hypothetical protein ACOCW1_05290 [Chitinispirillaceae bacterium]